MPSILTARDLAKTYGSHTLFTGVSLGLTAGERLGLIGPNGSGKSTLVKILAGLETPDAGEVTRRRRLRIAYVAQDDRFDDGATPLSAVVDRLRSEPVGDDLDAQTRAAVTLSKLGFVDQTQPVATLSGGWRKRLSIACALAGEPGVLMLDEPTNHLDLAGVVWLEQFARQAGLAIVIVTHDRTFLERVATRIVELSAAYPGGTFEVRGNYSEFVRRKAEFLDSQASRQQSLAGKVRRDTAWLRQGIQGRRTRNKAQVAAADVRRAELKGVRDRNAATRHTTAIDFQATERKTKKLLAAHNVSKSMGARRLFDKLSLTLCPGMRLGVLGPNGSGKTTLLRLLCGSVQPDSGTVKPAAELRIVNFTQHREALNPTQTLREALCPVGDTVRYRDKPVHVAGWARKFLFDPGQFNTSVGDLSGGEQARVLIANLMLRPADLLVLDEPTNDLDIPSLEVLEQALEEFPGAIVLVTHDRFMLGRLCTELIALDGLGNVKSYADYAQWCQASARETGGGKADDAAARSDPSSPRPRPAGGRAAGKLSYKLQRELDLMEQTILEAEAELRAAEGRAAEPSVIADLARHAQVCHELVDARARVEQLYDRWAELDAIQRGG